MALTRSLAHEWARHGVTVNCIAPGQVATGLSAPLHEDPQMREWMLSRIPMRRVGTVEEVASMAVYLASDAAGYITCQTVVVDEGWVL